MSGDPLYRNAAFRSYLLPLILKRKLQLRSENGEIHFKHPDFVRDLVLEEYQCAYAWRIVEQEVHNMRGVKEILGYEQEAFTTEFILSSRFIHPDDIQETMYLLKMALESEMATPSGSLNLEYSLTFRARKHDGDYIPLRSDITILDLSSDGRLRSCVVVATDLERSGEAYQIGMQVHNRRDRVHEANTLHTEEWHLTPREQEVLGLLMDGMSSKMIGEDLGISKNTVDNLRKRLLHKTSSSNTADLVRKAIQGHFISPGHTR